MSHSQIKNREKLLEGVSRIQQILYLEDELFMFYRPSIAEHLYMKLNMDTNFIEEINVSKYLEAQELYILRNIPIKHPLEIDFSPSHHYPPSIEKTEEIGRGSNFLLQYLADHVPSKTEKWKNLLFQFLKTRVENKRCIELNEANRSHFHVLAKNINILIEEIESQKADIPNRGVKEKLLEHGFGEGMGDTIETALKNLKILKKVFDKPAASDLKEFFSSLPFFSKIAIVSPHGWFGQEKVWGKPDTGGQVIYILDQARSIEKTLKKVGAQRGAELNPRIIVLTRLIPKAGETTCNIRWEKIQGSENCWILRVPFREKDGKIVEEWISRFQVWPYLDRYAQECKVELQKEFAGKPDLIIGNYSDGNIVASLLSDSFDTILCTIAHALEKTKYHHSDLRWHDLEDQYHFSLHFTSDLLAIDKSDFIITSTFQEIAGTERSTGQYELYESFTLPGYYRVVSGSDIRDPKYNINPPGVDEMLYFPFYENDKRDTSRTSFWKKRLFYDRSSDILGDLENPQKPPLFSMARLDKIKNLSGLIEAYGNNPALQNLANLIIVAGTVHFEESTDQEERIEIKKIYDLVEQYHLYGKLRWLPSINKRETGEVYRIVADSRGIFVQPALYEAFGLTILEAMISGLPTFGTTHGGPSEIIEDGKCGFLINPHNSISLSSVIFSFLKDAQAQPSYWKKISDAGIERVRKHFTWSHYSERLLTMANLYDFWKFVLPPRDKMIFKRYWNIIYHFLMKEKAAK